MNKQFVAAVAIAGIYGQEKLGWMGLIKAGWAVLRAITTRGGKASMETFEARMKCCEECPLFYSPLNTCGSVLTDNPSLGCGCYLPLKNKLPEATCWMDDNFPGTPPHSWLSKGIK